MSARLLFIGALNFANDYGVLADSPKRLKMQVFPADSIDVEPLIDELVFHGMWERAEHPTGKKVLLIRGFVKHQVVNRPNDGEFGNPATWDVDSRSTHGALTEQAVSAPPRNGREWNGREGNGKPTTNVPNKAPVENGGGGKLKTEAAAISACIARGWTPSEIEQRIDGIDDDPTIVKPQAVALTRLRAMATETPPGTTDPCDTCHGDAMILVEDGATRCTDCNGQGTTPRTHRTDQRTF